MWVLETELWSPAIAARPLKASNDRVSSCFQNFLRKEFTFLAHDRSRVITLISHDLRQGFGADILKLSNSSEMSDFLNV